MAIVGTHTVYAVEFLVNGKFTSTDYSDKALARAAVEANGVGSIITFVIGYDKRARSCALESYNGSVWNSHNIH